MPGWRARFKFKDLLDHDDVGPQESQRLAGIVVDRLSNSPFLPASRKSFVQQFKAVVDQDDFNRALKDLYDRADYERIWVE